LHDEPGDPIVDCAVQRAEPNDDGERFREHLENQERAENPINIMKAQHNQADSQDNTENIAQDEDNTRPIHTQTSSKSGYVRGNCEKGQYRPLPAASLQGDMRILWIRVRRIEGKRYLGIAGVRIWCVEGSCVTNSNRNGCCAANAGR